MCPVDFDKHGFIISAYLKNLFIDRFPENVNMVVLMDCCHSGSIIEAKYEYLMNNKSSYIVNPESLVSNCNVTLISGCRDDQTSADAWLPDYKTHIYENQGAMTSAFITTYTNTITNENLIINMREWLKTNQYTQVPQISSGRCISIKTPYLLTTF